MAGKHILNTSGHDYNIKGIILLARTYTSMTTAQYNNISSNITGYDNLYDDAEISAEGIDVSIYPAVTLSEAGKPIIEPSTFTKVNVKDKTITQNGTHTAGYKEAWGQVIVNVPSGADLEDKTVTITANGETEILPSAGKDGMTSVTATVSVAAPKTALKLGTSSVDYKSVNTSATPAKAEYNVTIEKDEDGSVVVTFDNSVGGCVVTCTVDDIMYTAGSSVAGTEHTFAKADLFPTADTGDTIVVAITEIDDGSNIFFADPSSTPISASITL